MILCSIIKKKKNPRACSAESIRIDFERNWIVSANHKFLLLNRN